VKRFYEVFANRMRIGVDSFHMIFARVSMQIDTNLFFKEVAEPEVLSFQIFRKPELEVISQQ
jgi:hypothetical protein